MLISVNWLRDFVDLPDGADVPSLAEQFTLTCAEVESVERIDVGSRGLIAAQVVAHQPIPQSRNLHRVVLDVGGRTIETVSAAPALRQGDLVVFGPPGSHTTATGALGKTRVAGAASEGMILPGDAVGIAMCHGEAVLCPPHLSPGDCLDADLPDDWVIEVDNKSITHRPDLWGHYGIARELAAMLGAKLRAYPVTDLADLQTQPLPAVEIEIDDAERCPRYSALRIAGVGAQAAPLWMQTRLGRVGMRPIDCLVDLSNYIMAELGQPTHAFDGDRIARIEVGTGAPGSRFTTLDGVERTLPLDALMIQCQRKPVALAGIMGGRQTEVSPQTRTILLESANFDPACIRRCAAALGLRTEASARFEKSLDPAYTVLAIQRFVHLARKEFPELSLASRLSDCYPKPAATVRIDVDPAFVKRFVGHDVSTEQISAILTALDFGVEAHAERITVTVPSYRATKDVTIEADVIEEIARKVGYNNIVPSLPVVAVRHFEASAQHRVERDTLAVFCLGRGYSEVHLYVWYDDGWLKRLGVERPVGIELRNPAAAGQALLRKALMPGMLQATERNRLHADEVKLCELGTVFGEVGRPKAQWRRLALVSARRGKSVEDDLLAELKGDIECWSLELVGLPATFVEPADLTRPIWAHDYKTTGITIGGESVGMASVVPLALRRRIDEHLGAWGIAWAEIQLDPLCALAPADLRLRSVPEHPEVDLDFSILVRADLRFGDVNCKLVEFDHPLLRRMTYVNSYEGKSIPQGKRSLTYRTRIGAPDRTLVDGDLVEFRRAFEGFAADCGFQLRR